MFLVDWSLNQKDSHLGNRTLTSGHETGLEIPDFKLNVITGMRFWDAEIRVVRLFCMWDECE